jgi:antirestriction protein ArdC
MSPQRIDVYRRVTDQIVAQLEAGTRPWIQPWNATHAAGQVSRPLRFNAMPYRGINVVLLWMSALRRQFASPLWMTYRQAAELGGQVRRGETGSLVVYADTFTRRRGRR